MASESFFCSHCGAAYSLGDKQCAFCQHILSDEPDLSDQGTLFHERYELLNQIGTGGFGAVYRARDTYEQQQLVAIKQINLQGLTTQEIIEATDGFNRERQFLASLSHDHLPRIYDHFMDAEHWYLIMQFIDGQTLEAYLQSMSKGTASFVRSLSVDEIVDIGLQLCDVLGYLHSQRQPIIFRDLKPSNVMRTHLGAIYLIDFGIARYFKPGKPKDTIPFGSPGYAAPEQYGKGQTTVQADIYSLGAMLYYMLSGLDPAENPFHFAPLRLYGTPGLAELEALIMQMVALDAQDRPGTVDVVTIELQHIRRLRGNSAPRIWRPPVSPNPQATGSTSYWSGVSGQSGQQQVQMPQPQAQSQAQAGTPGMGRRTLIQRGWRLGLAVGIGAMILHNVFPSAPPSNNYHSGYHPSLDAPGLALRSISEQNLSVDGGMASITKVSYAPTNDLLAAADQAGNIFVLSTGMDQQVVYQLHVPQSVTSISWSFDAQYLSIAADSIYTWQIPPVVDGMVPGKISKAPLSIYRDVVPAAVQTISWHPSELVLAVSDVSGNVRVFQVQPGGIQGKSFYQLAANPGRSPLPRGPRTVSLTWSDSQLYIVSDRDSVKTWSLDGLPNESATFEFADLHAPVQEIIWLPGTISNPPAIVLTADGLVHFLDGSTNYQSSYNVSNIGEAINSIAYSPASGYLFGVTDSGIYAWYASASQDDPIFFAQKGPMQTIDCVSNNYGNFVVTGGLNGAIQIWQIE